MENSSFWDVGCGSGLFSIAAHQLGANPVIGLDYNPRRIAVSRQNEKRFAQESSITFLEASILDDEALASLDTYDDALSIFIQLSRLMKKAPREFSGTSLIGFFPYGQQKTYLA